MPAPLPTLSASGQICAFWRPPFGSHPQKPSAFLLWHICICGVSCVPVGGPWGKWPGIGEKARCPPGMCWDQICDIPLNFHNDSLKQKWSPTSEGREGEAKLAQSHGEEQSQDLSCLPEAMGGGGHTLPLLSLPPHRYNTHTKQALGPNAKVGRPFGVGVKRWEGWETAFCSCSHSCPQL